MVYCIEMILLFDVLPLNLVCFLPDTHCEWDMRFTNEILLCHGDSVTNWTQTDPHRENGTTHHIHPHPGEREKKGRAGLNTHSLVICCIHSWMQATLAWSGLGQGPQDIILPRYLGADTLCIDSHNSICSAIRYCDWMSKHIAHCKSGAERPEDFWSAMEKRCYWLTI